ncbi:MAG: hypothetical protein WBA61_04300 [Aequorivita sp.]
MKNNTTQTFLFVIGIISLPFTLYRYYTLEHSDFKYLLGAVLSVWLIYDYYIYKTKRTHILESLKEHFRNKDSE